MGELMTLSHEWIPDLKKNVLGLIFLSHTGSFNVLTSLYDSMQVLSK